MDKKYADWFRSIVEVEAEQALIGEVGHLDMRFDDAGRLHVFVYSLCGCSAYGLIVLRDARPDELPLPAPYLPVSVEWSRAGDDLGFDVAPAWKSLQRPGWSLPVGATRW